MVIFFATLVVFLLSFIAMAIGYILQRKKIQGSCGGIGALGLEKVCDCPEPCDARKARIAKEEERRKKLSQHRIS